MLTHLADAFTAASVLAGLWAAFLWWRSARVEIKPTKGIPEQKPSPTFVAIHMLQGALTAWKGVGSLNSKAATWTAASIVAQAVATILGRLGGG